MTESEYIGNFKEYIDCDGLVKVISSKEGDIRTPDNPYGNPVGPDDPLYSAKIEMRDIWQRAGYMDSDSVQWINFYGGIHFDNYVVEKFSKLVNAEPYNVWVSSMMPGKCVPLHWDIIKDYEKYKTDSRMVRYSFFIDNPSAGKVFVLNNEAYHMIEQGSVYKWKKWDEWHLGFNCGNTQKFMFHFIGFSNVIS